MTSAGEHKNQEDQGQFIVNQIEFKLHVDPNHCLGSTIKLTNKDVIPTLYNLCSTLVIHVENRWMDEEYPRRDERSPLINTAKSETYKQKYEEAFTNVAKPKRWTEYYNISQIDGECPELAWAFPSWVDPGRIKYTSSLTAGLVDLTTVDTNRQRGKGWSFLKNKQNFEKAVSTATYPVIETCGVVVLNKNKVLTFPSLKFASMYSTPGGSVDWKNVPPPKLSDQVDIAVTNCWRELKEEAGLLQDNFDLETRGVQLNLPTEEVLQNQVQQQHKQVLSTLFPVSDPVADGTKTYRVFSQQNMPNKLRF